MVANDSSAGRRPALQRMFSRISERYDLINHIFTWGMDSGWRRRLVTE